MGKVYQQKRRIHMSDCDPAGIVFHPQYLVMIAELMEDFYRDVASMTFAQSLSEGISYPIGGIRVDFCRPSALGDEVMLSLWVESIGTTSIRFAITIEGSSGERVRCVETVVCVKVGETCAQLTKHPIPEDFKAVLQTYLGASLSLRA